MTTTGTTQTANETRDPRKDVVLQKEANEWGQLTGLEPHATYLVVRKPTPEWTKERSREFVEDVRAFLHEHRVLTDQQVTELNQRYGEPAKQRVKEIRETLEKRFDEIAKELEARFEQVEKEVQTRFGRKGGEANETTESTSTGAETPGEMPTGAAPAAETTPAAEPATGAADDAKPKKKTGAKKSE